MAFRGWPAEALDFLEDLEHDNTKAFWDAHRDVYQRAVRGPMDELLAGLAGFGPGRVFRPYRDVRFAKDKAPYKTNIAAMVGEHGYVSLSAAGLGAGSGIFHMAPDQLERYRQTVADDRTGSELAGLLAPLVRSGHEVIAHDALKTSPRGYPKDHPRIDLLRRKGLAVWRQWEPTAAWLSTRKAKDRVEGVLRAAQPVNEWLAAHVGPTTMDQSRR